MGNELFDRLRDCSPDERRGVAMDISRIGTKKSVKALILMVDGVRVYRRGWKTFGFRRAAEYFALEDQLTAVDALGETGSRKAFNYLVDLGRADSIEHQVRDPIYQSDGQTLDDGTELEWYYPNARGEIRKALDSRSKEVMQRIHGAIDRLR